MIEFANRSTTPQRSFLVDPLAFARVEAGARERGLALRAWFHSHPRGLAVPSASDLARAWPDVELWIGSPAGHRFTVAGFRADGRPLWRRSV